MTATATVVIIEDSPTEAAVARAVLAGNNHLVQIAPTGMAGIRMVERVHPDAVLLDINLPDMNGLDVLDHIRKTCPGISVVIVTGEEGISTVVDAMRRGAFDYVSKPFTAERIRVTVRNAVERHRLNRLVEDYGTHYADGFLGMVGNAPVMHAVYRIIECAAPSGAAVFITGESGTGKELCAEAIHRASPRGGGPFIAINCAALPSELAESELFGHVRGAFTGATGDRAGAAELADGGTLFLDEVCEMPLELQAKLLRFVQTGTYRKVGDGRLREADVRLVAATNRDPRAMVAKGAFREDLYYRLHVIPIHMPALRDRGKDVVTIARHLLTRIATEEGKTFDGLTPDAEARLADDPWPGNVRELENTIRLAVVMNDGPDLSAAMLAAVRPARDAIAPHMTQRAGIRPLSEVERDAIETAIAIADGNVTRAAHLLGINPSTIHRKRRTWAQPDDSEAKSQAV